MLRPHIEAAGYLIHLREVLTRGHRGIDPQEDEPMKPCVAGARRPVGNRTGLWRDRHQGSGSCGPSLGVAKKNHRPRVHHGPTGRVHVFHSK